MIVSGIPRLKNVAGVSCEILDLVEPLSCGVRVRLAGSEDDMVGLSVSRLWMSGFRFARVPTLGPVSAIEVAEALNKAELAASDGVVSKADDEGGRSVKQFLISSKFRVCCCSCLTRLVVSIVLM
jgi:hypothetical protein